MARPRIYHDRQEEVVHLYTLGWTVREIADETGIPKSTVHRMVHRNG